MDRLTQALLIAVFAMMGMLLIAIAVLPAWWEVSLPVTLFPASRELLQHGAVRGFVAAVGVLNLAAAFGTLRGEPREAR